MDPVPLGHRTAIYCPVGEKTCLKHLFDFPQRVTSPCLMDYSPSQTIIRLATDAAHEVVGADANVRVEVETGTDSSDRPAYFFVYRIRKNDIPDLSPGLIRIRLIQHIVDKLIALGDTHEPIIRSMTLSGWETPSGA